MKVKILPGLNNSGADHWQSIWEKKYGFERVQQDDWKQPKYNEWEKNLIDNLQRENDKNIILIAHSLGCLLTAKAITKIEDYVKAIFLVAPPDTSRDIFPKEINSFNNLPNKTLGVPGILVYSEDDQYASAEYSLKQAKNWGLQAVSVGKRGHINSDSNIENWDQGYEIFQKLLINEER
ncbi:RBBP9/YdeN family alpha/beta hydrolase [Clostridium cellulovorans]|uniref:Alpha/beta hydrolase n=1 Tax=Clostridium cellulovorans (strain ATCC 35296 / DSM 3052 / OCM 3 / 743B) TaxID=573061 RepID=D9SR21_CLOC7|nr:alpha/beta hydrolase [Clostridium cellulovorans]ADL50309.1 protein of unknown function DUF1234 [Clostridium cellulovorans 743B]